MPNHRVCVEKKDNNSLSNGFEIIAETKLCTHLLFQILV
jgi:hypothetical protein